MSTLHGQPLAVIDSGGANIGSVLFALKRLGIETDLTSDPEVIQTAQRVLLPGVGAADQAMRRLNDQALVPLIRSLKQPVLGICVGMQLLFDGSDESATNEPVDCLGVIPGRVTRLIPGEGVRVPHMGWNRLIDLDARSPLLTGIQSDSHCFFVHSYAAPVSQHSIASCQHGQPFSAMVSHGNFHGAQFHPERSAVIGHRLLENFMAMTA